MGEWPREGSSCRCSSPR